MTREHFPDTAPENGAGRGDAGKLAEDGCSTPE